MRTTIRIDDQLLREAKKIAAQSGGTLTALIEDALREAIARRRQQARRQVVVLTTARGRGPRPGVDLDHTAELADLMDRDG